MAGQPHKVLRIGVVHGGKLVEERVLPAGKTVTAGKGATNAIAVPQSSMPDSTTVFEARDGGYTLVFEEGADGRVDGPAGSADLGALVSQGVARREGKIRAIDVSEDQRGKLVLGDVTLLWQFVDPPPEAPPQAQDRLAKGNRFTSMDRLFGTVLAVSFLLHSGAYVALARADLPKEVTIEEIPDRYAKVLIPDRAPKAPAAEEKKAGNEQKVEKKVEKKQETTEQTAERKAARAAAVAKAVQSKGILKVLGALGPGTAHNAVADVFGSGGGVGDVATALSGAGGVAVATDPGAAGGRKGGGQGGAASIGELATTGGGKVAYGTKTEVKVKVSGSVAAEEAEVDSSDIDQGKLGAFVRARMGLIKACYENALKRNPALKGKIAIRFTILETGGLADVSPSANTMGSPEVASCIVNTMRGWRTQFRPPGPVTVEYPFVFQPVN
ncbi:MAG TPA: AgmX/PglI C-terminal domain-containing protein [Anaeromyxobacteraceae bacterium]|nr:AgmX/PglI C-terminal domain-containing protein [Anaeromyxobacteraceae bacterium]